MGRSDVDDRGTSALLKRSAQQALRQFRRAAAGVPFYRRLLSSQAVRPSRITTIEKFQTLVPRIAKRDVFSAPALGDLLVDRSFNSIETLTSSSGATAQSFSLGMVNRAGTRSMVRATDRLLDQWFDVSRKKTFLINTFAMGVKIPTSLPCIDLSVRSDKAIAIIKAVTPYFRQLIVTSDVFFLKKLLEDGRTAGLDWRRLPVHFVIGGEWFPETYRQYLAQLLDVDLSVAAPRHYILASMGAAELGFNLCYETHDMVRLRQLVASDDRLCRALFGVMDTVPLIGHYDPRRWFLEVTPTPDLDAGGGRFAFTDVDLRSAMPLIRYETGDFGHIISPARLRTVLRDFNYEAYMPIVSLPMMAVAGRQNESVAAGGKSIRMEFLRSLLYSDRLLAAQTTGQFQASADRDRLHVDIQLQVHLGADSIAPVQERFSQLLQPHIPADVRAVSYFDFHHGMGVDYERKFSHLVR